jgi:type IV secretory pathway TrbL component
MSVAMQWIVLWGVIAIGASILSAVLAGVKNRDYSYWVAWSFLVPPLVLWLLFLPRYKGPRPRQPRLDDIDRHENGPF